MRNFRGTESGEGRGDGHAPPPGSQAFMAAIIGAIALSVVMVVILLSALQASRTAVVSAGPKINKRASLQADARNLKIDYYTARTKTGPLGSRELIVAGRMKNTGSLAVEAADLRCYFTADSGNQIHFDFPLVVDSSLDDLGEGPLPPRAGRNFSARLGKFPDGFASDITRIEVINVWMEKG